MIKKVVGILAFVSFLGFVSIGSVLMSQGQLLFDGGAVQAFMATLTSLVVFSGLHLIETHCISSKITKMTAWSLGLILLIFGILVSFDIVSIKGNWNYLLSLGILYITIVQLNLLDWEKRKGILKVLGLLIILANVFLIIFFFTKLSMRSMALVFDISVLTSVFAFLIALILSRRKKKKTSTAGAS